MALLPRNALNSSAKWFVSLCQLIASATAAAQAAETVPPHQESRATWTKAFSTKLQELKQQSTIPPRTAAKNVILFIGDGMGISTVTAARILEGQEIKKSPLGEENQLSFESFPNVALARTFSANQQVSDSAPTMTAMITGVKTNEGILSIDQSVQKNDHTTYQPDPSKPRYNRLTTLLELAESAGLVTGVVSTARVTHATPAACYAHSPNRDWECDADLKSLNPDAFAANFPDIAKQLIHFSVPGNPSGIEVILGGGSDKFLLGDLKIPNATTLKASSQITVPSTAGLKPGLSISGTGVAAGSRIKSVDTPTRFTLDKPTTLSNSTTLTVGDRGAENRPESSKLLPGKRLDQDLVAVWKTQNPKRSAYVTSMKGLQSVQASTTDKLLGLFNKSHMSFEVERLTDSNGTPIPPVEPSLTEMTTKAIEILSRSPKGFFLHVEAGRIDHGHHSGNAYRALRETIALSDAVRKAAQMCGPDTLIIVAADHSHAFTIAGYPRRGNDIMGVVKDETGATALDLLGLPYTTLGYANGPGYAGRSYTNANRSVIAQNSGSKTYPHSPTTFDPATNRPNLLASGKIATDNQNFLQESTIPLATETHAGEDVGIWAKGPNAHLFRGSLDQSMIFWIMADALGLKSTN
jgi:alkaline phosphatase